MNNVKKLVISLSGASGVNLGLKLIECIPKNIEIFVTNTDNAKIVLQKELKQEINLLDDSHIWESIASGSFMIDAMIVAPCSMNTLAKIATGIADNLTTRCASVMIKERKNLVLAPREMPFSSIALENMLKLANIGVCISPPVMAYYADNLSLESMENFIVGKWLDSLRIEHNLYKRWQ